jgi:hypothetical protein
LIPPPFAPPPLPAPELAFDVEPALGRSAAALPSKRREGQGLWLSRTAAVWLSLAAVVSLALAFVAGFLTGTAVQQTPP